MYVNCLLRVKPRDYNEKPLDGVKKAFLIHLDAKRKPFDDMPLMTTVYYAQLETEAPNHKATMNPPLLQIRDRSST
jgi:hypothetical protein